MSMHSICLIPEDPRFVPDVQQQENTRQRFQQILGEEGGARVSVSEQPFFVDCGENFERIACPGCSAELTVDWWHECMDSDFDGQGMRLNRYATPCCNQQVTLHELDYQWPMGIARFTLEGDNLVGRLGDEAKQELEAMLGCRLRVIYRHY